MYRFSYGAIAFELPCWKRADKWRTGPLSTVVTFPYFVLRVRVPF